MPTTSLTHARRIVFVLAAVVALLTPALGVVPAPADASTRPGYDGRIAFDSVRADGRRQVYTMKPDGTDLQQVTAFTGQDSYSPQFPLLRRITALHRQRRKAS